VCTKRKICVIIWYIIEERGNFMIQDIFSLVSGVVFIVEKLKEFLPIIIFISFSVGLILLIKYCEHSKIIEKSKEIFNNPNKMDKETLIAMGIEEKSKNVCIKCGAKGSTYRGHCEKCYNEVYNSKSNNSENYTGLCVISFLIPIIGLIVYAVNIVQNPEVAKPVGRWALIGFIVGLIGMGIIVYSVI